jgi:ketosteroid isomerase-like protein
VTGLVLCALVVALAPHTHGAPTEVRQELAKVRAQWVGDMAAKKVDHLLTLYATDAMFVTPKGERFAGAGAIHGLIIQVTRAFDSQIHLRAHTFASSGELAFEDGDYDEIMVDVATKKQRALEGTFLFIYRHEAGSWRIVEQVWTERVP